MTLIFNIFVFYTLFNQINCRVIDDSLNIFIRITRSLLFPIICLAEMALQVVIIFVGKSPFHIVDDGLSGKQWGICIGFSAITFVVSIITKFIPIHTCIDKILQNQEKDEEEEEQEDRKETKVIKEIDIEDKKEGKKNIKMLDKNNLIDDNHIIDKDMMKLTENKALNPIV